MADERQAALATIYQEVCNSYHGIADFRAKLLGLLPLASGAGVFLLLDNALLDSDKRGFVEEFVGPLGLFGFVVTLGLFFYELRGIQRCNGLIEVGKKLEKSLNIDGQFRLRSDSVGGFIGSTLAARVIYPAVLAAWTFLALALILPQIGLWIAILVFLIGFGGSYMLKLDVKFDCQEQDRQSGP